MIAKMSKKVSFYFIKKNIVEIDDRELYEYSFEALFSTVLNFCAIIIIAFLFNSVLVTSLYLVGFIPMRLIAGGYHATTHLRCFLLLICSYSLFLLVVKLAPMSIVNHMSITFVAISAGVIFVLAPVADDNKPLSAVEYKRNKARSRIMVIFYFVVLLFMIIFIKNSQIAFSVVMGLLSVALSLLAGYIGNRKASEDLCDR